MDYKEKYKNFKVGERISGSFPIGNIDQIFLSPKVIENKNGILKLEAGTFVGTYGGFKTKHKYICEINYGEEK